MHHPADFPEKVDSKPEATSGVAEGCMEAGCTAVEVYTEEDIPTKAVAAIAGKLRIQAHNYGYSGIRVGIDLVPSPSFEGRGKTEIGIFHHALSGQRFPAFS